MDTETRAAFDETRAAFARIDHWFELLHVQHVETRREIRELREGQDELKTGLARLEAEFRRYRDWVAAELSHLRSSVQQLTRRVDLLE